MDNTLEKLTRPLIDGKHANFENCIGFCHCDIHRGFLTKTLVKKHRCLEKKCTFFQKQREDYWVSKKAERTSQQKRRDKIKTERKNQKQREEIIRQILGENPSVYVTAILSDNDRTTICYASNELVDLTEEIQRLHQNISGRIYLKSVSPIPKIRKILQERAKS